MTRGDGTTIVACASPPGVSPEAVLRISGPRAFELVAAFETDAPWPPPGGRGAADGWLSLTHPPVPVALWRMPGPRSFTGEDTVEVHLPGNPLLVRRMLDALIAAGAESAAPGAFIRRAFEHGRLDLLQVEAVLSLIRAADDAHARAALDTLGGETSARARALADALLAASAVLEASLDFADRDLDDDLGADLEGEAAAALRALRDDSAALAPRLVGQDRPRVLLYGAANAGKSTLFNALLGADRAVVDAAPGTTRDPVRAPLTLGETTVELIDPAGVGEPRGDVDARAQAAARELLASADLVVLVAPVGENWPEARGLRVRTKIDLGPGDGLGVCAPEGAGIPELRQAVQGALRDTRRAHRASSAARQQACLDRFRAAVDRALALLEASAPAELAALELAEAREAIGALTGEYLPEDLLGAIFDRFCVGK